MPDSYALSVLKETKDAAGNVTAESVEHMSVLGAEAPGAERPALLFTKIAMVDQVTGATRYVKVVAGVLVVE